MAIQLDLEEQEQLDQLRHFWERWGNWISSLLIVVALGFAGWNLYHFWERRQAAQSSVLFDEVNRAAQAGDSAKAERAFSDIRERFGRTTYAQQAGLIAARAMQDKGNTDGAKAALAWVADKGRDAGLQAVARLRTSAILMDSKAWDEALRQLDAAMPAPFAPLAADRKGDILVLQGKPAEAVAAYTSAWKDFGEQSEYRRLVEVKLNALGADPKPATATGATS